MAGRPTALVAALVVALVACGGSSEPDVATPSDPSTTARRTTTAAPATTVRPTTTARPTSTTTAPPTTTALLPPPGYPGQPAGVPFPTTEWGQGELPTDVDRAAIDAAVDMAFGAPDAEGRVQSVVVVVGGQIVYERYHPLDGPDKIYDSWSVAKSFTSALIGLLVADGDLALDEHPARPEWQAPGDPRQTITLRQLLQMSSGLDWEERYEAGTIGIRMFTADDAATLMAAQPLERDPGSAFEYSTGTTALLAGIAADELGGCQPAIDYLNARLLDPIGITTEQLATDGRGAGWAASAPT